MSNLDDLARIAAENRQARQSEIVKCQEILVQRAGALWLQVDALLNRPVPVPATEAAPVPSFGLYARGNGVGLAV